MAQAGELSLKRVQEALQRISPYIHQTHVLTSSTFDQLSGVTCFYKAECFQKTGSFKVRGALNAVLVAKQNNPDLDGVVTHSSGNHGQALAWAACQVAKIKCTVVVPSNTPKVKCAAIEGYGAELVLCEPNFTSRKETCDRIAKESNRVIIPPYDHYDVICGQATIAVELLEQVPNLDAILVPVSGGGMVTGIALATKWMHPKCKVICVEPKGKELQPCLETKSRLWNNPPQFVDTIAEGIRTQQCGFITFPLMCELVEPQVITVTNQEMVEAMKATAERMKVVLEASAGAAVAAAGIGHNKQLLDKYPDVKRVGVILCGGNVDIDCLPWMQ